MGSVCGGERESEREIENHFYERERGREREPGDSVCVFQHNDCFLVVSLTLLSTMLFRWHFLSECRADILSSAKCAGQIILFLRMNN